MVSLAETLMDKAFEALLNEMETAAARTITAGNKRSFLMFDKVYTALCAGGPKVFS